MDRAGPTRSRRFPWLAISPPVGTLATADGGADAGPVRVVTVTGPKLALAVAVACPVTIAQQFVHQVWRAQASA